MAEDTKPHTTMIEVIQSRVPTRCSAILLGTWNST
jgi:hypothetical protein